MEQCIEAMLEDEQRERRAGPRQPRPPRDPDAPTYVSYTNLHVSDTVRVAASQWMEANQDFLLS